MLPFGGGIHIFAYISRLSLEQNTRKLSGFTSRLANWAAGEQVYCMLICAFKIVYSVQVVLTLTFFNVRKLRRER